MIATLAAVLKVGGGILKWSVANWKPLLIIGLVAGANIHGYRTGLREARAACEAANRAAQDEKERRDREINLAAEAFEQAGQARAETLEQEIEKLRLTHVDEVKARPHEKRCPAYGASDLERLRKLRGIKGSK